MNNDTAYVTIKDRIATVILNNPSEGNIIDEGMASTLNAIFIKLNEDENIAVVVISATGPVFSTGRTQISSELSIRERRQILHDLNISDNLTRLRVPTIASINGDAMEHGLEIALCADIRICNTSTRFRCNDLYNGSAFPIDGGTQRLPRVIGTSWTMDMLLTGRIVDAQEALSIGLVNKVVKNDILENTTSELASLIASGATIANQYAKEAVYSGMEINLTDGLRLETDLNVILQSTYDRSEGIKSFLEKRPPIFKGE